MEKIIPNLQFSVLCDDVIQDRVSGKFVLYGLFDNIKCSKLPAVHPRLYIVNRWCNGFGEFKQRTRIINPAKEKLIEDREVEVRLKDTKSKHTVISQFTNIAFKEQGFYWAEIYLDDKLLLSYPFNVDKIK